MNQDNINALIKLVKDDNAELVEIKAKDLSRDIETSPCKVTVSENENIVKTRNLRAILKICVTWKTS